MIPDDGASQQVFSASTELANKAHIQSLETYKELYAKSVENPEEFWKGIAEEFYWEKQPTGHFLDYNFDVTKGKIYIEWMKGGTTNICYNVLDRNVKEKKLGDRIAFYWEGNKPGTSLKVTYNELLQNVCKCANILREQGVKKGDRVSIYMPMIIELVVAMLACARIGAVHSVVFAGFSADSLCERIIDSHCALLITADGFCRGDKQINLKQIADEALHKCKEKNFPVTKCIVVKHLRRTEADSNDVCVEGPSPIKKICQNLQIPWNAGIDLWWHDLLEDASNQCEPEWCDAEDDLFILYTSGSTGKPKGVVHSIGGYMIFTATTFKYVFDYHPDDVYWCTADIGWITGHSYITYGPLANAATSVLFEGLPIYPDESRMWQIVDKYKVSKFYTAPTAIRLLMKHGDEPVKRHSRRSLKILGTVGEPINPEAWLWYYRVVGEERCPIVDTFWQTETGGHVMTPLPGATPLKPGSAEIKGQIQKLFAMDKMALGSAA